MLNENTWRKTSFSLMCGQNLWTSVYFLSMIFLSFITNVFYLCTPPSNPIFMWSLCQCIVTVSTKYPPQQQLYASSFSPGVSPHSRGKTFLEMVRHALCDFSLFMPTHFPFPDGSQIAFAQGGEFTKGTFHANSAPQTPFEK